MDRHVNNYLDNWLISQDRKPLVVRGARQVGKTWLIRHFAKLHQKKLIEINFEKNPAHAALFESNDPAQILLGLGILHNDDIDPATALLFLDEIQVAPHVFIKLRWFAEDLPQLPVIAAGSFLEFLLADHSFSMPVGRINYMYLEPLSFEEFLLAHDKKKLCDYLSTYQLTNPMPLTIHEQLLALFKEYILIGGLPAAVLSWVTERSFSKVAQIHNDLLATYRDDFAKYKSRIAAEKIDRVMMAVPKMLGEKFKYSRVSTEIQASSMKEILSLLEKARLCYRVSSTAGNGVPLQAEINEKQFKETFIDVGLCSIALGLDLNELNAATDITLVNNGGIAEQVVGQMLRVLPPPYVEPALYYWLREEKNANAELDYLLQYGSRLIPIEVKAGSSGTLKSLHVFMDFKKLPLAVRINADLPSKTTVNVKNHKGDAISYELLSLPFYLVGQLYRYLE